MTTRLLFVFSLLAAPALAQDDLQDLPIDERAETLSAKAITKDMQNPGRPGQAEISRLFQSQGGYKMCATTDAYNASGTYIGRTYWEVTLDGTAQEVVNTKDVTGLLSPCYGVDYKPFKQLIDGAR